MLNAPVETLTPYIPTGVQYIDRIEDLSTIDRADCAAVIWQRRPLRSARNWIDTLPVEQLPKARLILPVERVHQALTQCCDSVSMPSGPERTRLIDDMAALADVFAKSMKARHLRLRLDVVDTNACRKFHRDVIRARLVCTYRGTGTQYGTATAGTDPQRVFTVPNMSPIVMRGTQWPETPASGLLHRSPPIEGSGETRLLLVLDPIFDPEDAI